MSRRRKGARQRPVPAERGHSTVTEEPEPSDGIDLPKVALPPEDPEVAHADELRRMGEYWDEQLNESWLHVFGEPRPVKA